MRRLADIVLRIAVLAFCWTTALYAFITSSAFAYLQFIKPRVFHWLGTFADWHWAAAWLWLLILIVLLLPYRRRGGAAAIGAGVVAAIAVVEVVLDTWTPVLPSLRDGPRSVAIGVAALLPVFGIGLLDHIGAWSFLRQQKGAHTEEERQRFDGRVFMASLGTAMMLTAGYAVLASVSLRNAFEPDLLSAGLALGAVSALLDHLLAFSAVFVGLAVVARAGGSSVIRQYLLLLVSAAALFAGLFARFVGESVGLVHVQAVVSALAFGASVALVWGGMRLSDHVRTGRCLGAGLDVFFGPPPDREPGHRLAVALAAVLPVAWAFMLLASRMDWDFALLKSGVVCVWIVTFALVFRASPLRAVSTPLIAAVAAVPLVAHAAWKPTELQQHTLSRYAVHNASYLLADGLLRERQESSSFDRYLRANTGLTDVDVRPVAIDLAPSLTRSESSRPPDIFLFIVDSLRSDYLAPYNPEVHFTPRIAEFAAANLWFPNAFTRYGGTGLSVPAIWAGSALAHKQYIVPFDSMNALEKVVAANGYQRIQTHDHITEALWSGLDADYVLDRGKTEMQFDFCKTVDELGRALEKRAARDRPVFAQTRSLNLHVAAVRNGYVPPGKTYKGFEPPYAYRVELIDGCFGSFVDRLKRLDLYDRSIVVLTADHGELIGEDGRWGHSYHMFPQVVQVPLLMHFPGTHSPAADRGAVALTTDITPTIYAALGLRPDSSNGLTGRSLIGAGAAESADRRRAGEVLAASYGAVYAVVSRNGRRLYISDAIQEQDHAYERSALSDLHWSEVAVRPATRALGQLRIRRHVDHVARTYHLDRPF